jgi:hypothetical protein
MNDLDEAIARWTHEIMQTQKVLIDLYVERDLWRKTAFRLGTMLGGWQGDDPTAIVVEAYEAVEAGDA